MAGMEIVTPIKTVKNPQNLVSVSFFDVYFGKIVLSLWYKHIAESMEEEKKIQTWQKASLYYSITFKGIIAAPSDDREELTLKQGQAHKIGQQTLTLKHVKVNKKLYQPIEIEADVDFTPPDTKENTNKTDSPPSFYAVTGLLLQRRVELKLVNSDKNESFTIAENCYVFEVRPQLSRTVSGTKMEARLKIFSMDKLMTLNKYSKAYVARKLGSGILAKESAKFGLKANGNPLVETNVSKMSHLSYKFSYLKDNKPVEEDSEFIQPYLVQYNESFYDFLVRTSNRCGEFLYFEDGKLTLGLPNAGDVKSLEDYESVTIREVATEPMEIKDYVRDSMKEGTNVGELNYSVVEKQSNGFPKEAFPCSLSRNAELSSDEYFFPLVAEKYTNRPREGSYNKPGAKVMSSLKKITMSEIKTDIIVQPALQEMILSVTSTLQTNGKNKYMKESFAKTYKDNPEQGKDGKAVEFGTLDDKGWTTIDYYNDIHKHQHDLERQIICIDMGTVFAQVKLGQEISIDGLFDNYVIIEIQLFSEESGANKGQRRQIIYAIPTLTEGDTERYFPPVQPVPIIRKSGPQTAFVVNNDDPKFQGRVRVAYPWQSIKEEQKAIAARAGNLLKTMSEEELKGMDIDKDLKAQLSKLSKELTKTKAKRESLKQKLNQAKFKIIDAHEKLLELRDYINATPAKREEIKAAKDKEISTIKAEIAKLEKEKTEQESKKKASKSDVDQALIQQRIDDLNSKIEKKKAKKQSLEDQKKAMEDCAKEHDEKKNQKGYKLEKTNTKVQEQITNYKKLYNDEYVAPKNECKELEKKEKDLMEKEEKVKKILDMAISAFASPWIRIASPMATPGGGAFFKPRVGDEVLINYDNDNVERPYVVGSLFSKNSLDPGEIFDRASAPFIQMGKQISMSIVSPNGHHITFSDPDDGKKFIANLNPGTGFISSLIPMNFNIPNTKELAGGIHIGDRYGIYEIEMNSHERAVRIKSPLGTVNIDAFTGITINAPNGDVNIKGKNVNIEAGNKVTITSGMNIEPPDIGDPDFTCGSPILQQVRGRGFWRGVGTAFANAGRVIRAAAAGFGHYVLQYIPMGLTDMTAGGLADLSLLRHMFEIAIRPVDGTLLIKSKRYLMLEAGSGKAKIKSDRFAENKVEQIDSLEKFYKELIATLKGMNDKITNFYEEYAKLVEAARNAKDNYAQVAEIFLKASNVDGIMKKAFSMTENIKAEALKDEVDEEKLKEGGFNYLGKTYINMRGSLVRSENGELKELVLGRSVDFANAVINLHKYALTFPTLMDTQDTNIFKQAAMKALKKMAEKDLEKWNKKYNDSEPKSDFLQEQLFTKEDVQALLKRKTAAMYLVNVANEDQVKQNKFLELGFDESDIVDKKLNKDYNWKNFMTHFDHKTSHGNMWRIYALEWFWVPIKNHFKNPFGTWTEKEIWRNEHGHDGQILFSDNDGATLHIEGEGLKSETQSNLGNRDQLVKLLLSIK